MNAVPRFLVPLLLCSMAIPAHAEVPAVQSVISVTGEGHVRAVPDQAAVTTGVETLAPSPAAALAENSAAVNALLEVLTAHGVEARDVQTSGFNLFPQYRHDRNDGGEPTLIGYTVSNQLTIRVRELDRLGALLDALVQAGSNRMSGIEFQHADLEALTDAARRAAVAEARRRAGLYAEAAGVRVGAVLSISEAGASPPQPMYRMAMEADMAAATPIAAGEQQVQASVQVVFALEQD